MGTTNRPTWTTANAAGPHGTATAYTHSSGALLSKSGKRWTLTIGRVVHVLPAKASFDHAEQLLAKAAA